MISLHRSKQISTSHNKIQIKPSKNCRDTRYVYIRETTNPRKSSSYANTNTAVIQIEFLNAIPKHKQIKTKKMLLGCCMLLSKQTNYLFCLSVTYNLYSFWYLYFLE